MKQLHVQIMGQNYFLTAPEGGEQRLLSAVEKVDAAMCRIRDSGKVKSRDRIAVLAALNLAFEPDTAHNRAAAQDHSPAQHAAPDERLSALIAKIDQSLVNKNGQLL